LLQLITVLEELGFDVEDIAELLPQAVFPINLLLLPAVVGYEFFDLLSTKVPGPASFLGLDRHVELFSNVSMMVGSLLHLFRL
jgi:hypothetical protein